MFGNKGFTMLELMIVCIIIGICLAVAMPAYLNSLENAKISEAQKTINQMSKACFDFYAENDTLTGITIAKLNAQVGSNFQDNDDWAYTVTSTEATFLITARRKRGSQINKTISLDQDHNVGGTYPIP